MKINITKNAQEKLKEIIKGNSEDKGYVRLYIAGIGWGGPKFGIALDEQKENDEVYVEDEINYIVDKDLLHNYSVFNIEYTNNWLRNGFNVTANGASSNCR